MLHKTRTIKWKLFLDLSEKEGWGHFLATLTFTSIIDSSLDIN